MENRCTEPMMDYCEFFATEEEAIAACRKVNRGLNSKDPACCVVVDGPEDNYAVVDLETAKDCSTSAKILRSRAWLLPISYPVPIFSHCVPDVGRFLLDQFMVW